MKSQAWLCAGILAVLMSPYALSQEQKTAEVEQARKSGEQFLAAGKVEQALRAFKEADKRSKGTCVACLLGLAMAYAKAGDAKATLENADKAVRIAADDSNRAQAHSMRGHALIALAAEQPKRLQDAEAAFRQASQLQPDNANFHLSLGVALAKLLRDEEAVKEFNSASRLASDGSEVRELATSFATNPRRAREPFAPDFQVSTLTGEKISLRSFAGKVVVIDFWATWCPPCRAAVPDIKDMIKKYGAEHLVVISLSWDQDEKAWRDYIAKHEMNWLHARDLDSEISTRLGVRAVPTYLVIDGDGFIKERIVGTNPQQSIAYRLREKLQAMPQLAKK
jgi:thiol-disulfide isomerase/thioredoxin